MCRNLKLPMPLQCWLLPWRTPIFPHLSSCKRMRAFHTGVRLAALPHPKHAGAAGPVRRLHAARYVGTDAGRLYRRGAVVAAVRRRPRDVPRPHDAADRLQGAGWWCHTSSCLTQKKKKKIIKPLKSMYKRTLNTEHFAAVFCFFSPTESRQCGARRHQAEWDGPPGSSGGVARERGQSGASDLERKDGPGNHFRWVKSTLTHGQEGETIFFQTIKFSFYSF